MFQGLPWRVWVKKRRKDLDLTQADLAGLVAYSVEMIGHVERGLDPPAPELVHLLAQVLDVPPEQHGEFVRVARLQPTGPAGPEQPRRATTLRIPGLPATPLVGRLDDLALVHHALRNLDQQLVTITGLPGVGKTRLAMAVARDLEAVYPDGVHWLALAALREPALVLNAVAQTLGISQSSGSSLLKVIQSALATQRLLLVLDNCEQIQGLNAVLAALLPAPGVRILATSRRALRLHGEQLIRLAPLPTAPRNRRLTVEQLLAYPALALFLTRARETATEFTLDSSNAAAVAQVCAALDGLPLAIELAAVRIRVLPPAAMLARLNDRLTWLVDGPADLPAHQQTLAGALGWSYNLLDADHQLLFTQLSVFAGGFTARAAAAVCAFSGVIAVDTAAALRELEEWSLLYAIGAAASEPRYAMLETIHEFAAKHLRAGGAAAQLRRRHFEFYLALAAEAAAVGTEVDTWLRRLEDEQANFRAALEWGLSAEGDPQAAGRLAVALSWFWEARGYWQEGRQWLTRLLAQEDRLAAALAAQLRCYAGRFAYLQGDFANAEPLLATSLERSQVAADVATQIRALNTLGLLAFSQSDYRRAWDFHSRSLGLCRASGDQLAAATALNFLGTVAMLQGDQQKAEELLEESLSLRRASGDRRGMARSFSALGAAALQRADELGAQRYFEQSVTLFRALGDKLGLALALTNLGYGRLGAVDFDQAEIALGEALDLAREVGSAWCMSMALGQLGWVAIGQAELADATAFFQESLHLAQAHGIKHALFFTLLGLTQLALLTDNRAQAAEHMAATEQLQHEMGLAPDPFERRMLDKLRQQLNDS